MTACHALHHFAVLVSHAAGIQSDQEVFETRRHTAVVNLKTGQCFLWLFW